MAGNYSKHQQNIIRNYYDNKDAIAILDRAMTLAPETAVIHYHRGIVLASVGQSGEARNALSEALRLEPDADWAADADVRRKASSLRED